MGRAARRAGFALFVRMMPVCNVRGESIHWPVRLPTTKTFRLGALRFSRQSENCCFTCWAEQSEWRSGGIRALGVGFRHR